MTTNSISTHDSSQNIDRKETPEPAKAVTVALEALSLDRTPVLPLNPDQVKNFMAMKQEMVRAMHQLFKTVAGHFNVSTVSNSDPKISHYPGLKTEFSECDLKPIAQSQTVEEMDFHATRILLSMASMLKVVDIADLTMIIQQIESISNFDIFISTMIDKKKEFLADQLGQLIKIMLNTLDPEKDAEIEKKLAVITSSEALADADSMAEIQTVYQEILGQLADVIPMDKLLKIRLMIVKTNEALHPVLKEILGIHEVIMQASTAMKKMEEPEKSAVIWDCFMKLLTKGNFSPCLRIAEMMAPADKASALGMISQTKCSFGDSKGSLHIALMIPEEFASERSIALYNLAETLFDKNHIKTSFEVTQQLTDTHYKPLMLKKFLQTFMKEGLLNKVAECLNIMSSQQRQTQLKLVMTTLHDRKENKHCQELLQRIQDPQDRSNAQRTFIKMLEKKKFIPLAYRIAQEITVPAIQDLAFKDLNLPRSFPQLTTSLSDSDEA